MHARAYIIPRGEGFGNRTGDRAGDPAPEPIAGAGTISGDRNRRSRRTSAHIQRPQERAGAPERCTLVQIPHTMPERLQSHGSGRRTQARNSRRGLHTTVIS